MRCRRALRIVAASPTRIEPISGRPAPLGATNDGPGHFQHGREARAAVEQARVEVALLLGCSPEEIIFTSCGTESNNFAVKGLAMAQPARGKHVVVSAIEHFSVLHSARTLEKWGFQVSEVPVDKYGLVDPAAVKKAIRPDTVR